MSDLRTIDPNDPDERLWAGVFNAITRHPNVELIFSRRRAVADRTVAYIWRQVRREHRRRRLWRVRMWLSWLRHLGRLGRE